MTHDAFEAFCSSLPTRARAREETFPKTGQNVSYVLRIDGAQA